LADGFVCLGKIDGQFSEPILMKKLFFLTIFAFTLTIQLFAADPTIWTVNTRSEILKGDAKGVSIDDSGTISLAPKLNEVFNSQQSYIWSSVVDPAGNVYLGTGNDGKIFKVDPSGKGSLLTDLSELDVNALAIGKDGSLYAATSPDGKVYRIDTAGKAEVYFDPADKYIWSLAVLNDGGLAVGTGEVGKIYRVRSANAAPESSLLFDSSETHIISMAVDKGGNLFAGTDSNGIVLRITPDGKAFAVLDAALREIHELAVAPDGSVYALALSEAASTARPNPPTVTGQTADGTSVVVAVTSVEGTETPQPPKSRYDLTAAKSAVYRIGTDGSNEIIWSSAAVTGFSLYAHQTGTGVLLGTSDKGRIYNITRDGRETLLLQTNEGQVSRIITDGKKLYATSSNAGKLYNFGGESLTEGSYESIVRDAKNAALWGRIWWNSNGAVAVQTRTGNTAKPDETWSDWSPALTDAKGGQITSPKARFMQWRATLKSAASLNDVSVSYLANNIAPEVLAIQLFPTSVGLFANPSVQIDPNIETSGVDPTAFGLPAAAAVPPRRAYQRGAKSLQWTAEDRNGDKLEYTLYYRGMNEQNFKLLRDGLRDNFFTLDGLTLADGRYIFRIVARDTPSNPLPLALAGEKISEPIDVDNTAPQVAAVGAPQVSGEKVRITFEAGDVASFINRAEYSIDGGEWQKVYADDGISDSIKERYTFEVTLKNAGEYSVTLRVFDQSGNIGNARVLVRR
jgi:sugar lactone lactonase YvrE